MKKIYILALFITACGIFTTKADSIDISASSFIAPSSGSNVSGLFVMTFSIKNVGPNDIPSSVLDTIRGRVINQATSELVATIAVSPKVFSGNALLAGDTGILTGTIILTTNGSTTLCIILENDIDSNKLNDTLCSTFTVAATDLGVSAVSAPANGSTIKTATTTFTFDVKNFGTAQVILPAGVILFNITENGGSPLGIYLNNATTIAAGGTSSGLSVSGVPVTPGSNTYCVSSTISQLGLTDANTSNNSTCVTANVWAVGIEAVNEIINSIRYQEGAIEITYLNDKYENLTINLSNIIGQNIATKNIQKGVGTYRLEVPSGLSEKFIILSLSDESSVIGSKKIFLQ